MALLTRRRARPSAPPAGGLGEERPVMLATLGVPFDEEAAAFAVDSALEAGQPLVVLNVVRMDLLPCSFLLGYDERPEDPEVTAAVRAPAELAHSLGVRVERLRVRSPHPVDALVEIATERRPGLLVLGPDRSRLRAGLYRKAARAVRDRCPCLVWIAE